MTAYRGTASPCEHMTFLLPLDYEKRSNTFLSRFVSALGIFTKGADVVRCSRIDVGGTHLCNVCSYQTYFNSYLDGVQFRYRQEFWPQENLDMVGFVALYVYLDSDLHPFAGNVITF
jgi:hypothetical protein